MIRFVNNNNEIPDYPSSRAVLIDDSLLSEQAVIDRIEKALDAPYEKDNWDGFWDAITDLSWLDCSSVVLVHKTLPKLNGWDMKVYLEQLYDASAEWESRGANKAFCVYFLLDDKAKVDFFLPGKFPQPEVKHKRAPATHIGDIFEIPLPRGMKRYMQFVIVDSSQLGAWGVRVFKKEYTTEEKPPVEEIVKDSVDFYCNTRAIGQGILYELWSYYGKSSDLGDLNAMVFRTFDREIPGLNPQRWRVWKASQEAHYYLVLPRKYIKADYGAMCAPISVIDRIVSGRWFPVANVYDDYKGASLIERLLGKEHIQDHLAPKMRPNATKLGG